jgi:thiamine transporter ThiT
VKSTRKLILAALFLALGYVLPFLTGQIPSVGKMLLPMHIPVLLCGFVCGWQYGMIVGFTVPLFRSVLTGMPVMFPMAVGMAFELAAYGIISGMMYQKTPKKPKNIYISLIAAMIGGRVVWGLVSMLLYGIQGNAFSWSLFVAGALLNAIPGIIIQLGLIPVIIMILEKTGLMNEYVG